ncbi:MAG: 5'-methylthioadenosine/adenosylhomocysteine nucleosidase [Clostridia bacterium]|nr:5'-methylthioadenosine/adenosylhomocysteine nucleosidase [Clostridia bacterium]
MLGIIGAMDIEVKELCSMLELKEVTEIAGIKFNVGTLLGKDTVIAKCSEGKVNAAIAAQIMCLKYHTDKIINTGVAGGLLPEMDICDIVVATASAQHDYNITPLGYEKGKIPNIDTITFPCNKEMTDTLYEIASKIEGIKAYKGVVASGDQFINSNDKMTEIRNTFDAVCAEMEGGAIGQVCHLNKTSYCVLRAMSDKADNNSNIDFPTFVEMACKNTVTILKEYIKTL